VEIPGVGAGIVLVRVEVALAVGVGIGSVEAFPEGEAIGEGSGVGEIDGSGVGKTTGAFAPLFLTLTQTNFLDLLLHSRSTPPRFAVRPTFLQIAPLLTAACAGATEREVKIIPTSTIHVKRRLSPPLSWKDVFFVCTLLMNTSWHTVSL
jgi:hypothetical protein